MKKLQLLLILMLLTLVDIHAQSTAKKGPPDLSGNWIMKNSDGSIKYHFAATQTGNSVTFQCTDADRRNLVCQFNWDVPGNYILLGSILGRKFSTSDFSTTVGKYYGTTEAGRFTRNGKVYTIYDENNINQVIKFSLCSNNSFTCDAKFTISETLDNIHVNEKSVRINAPEPYLEAVLDVDRKTPVIVGSATPNPAYKVLARPSSSLCGVISYADNYDFSWDLVKVRDSW